VDDCLPSTIASINFENKETGRSKTGATSPLSGEKTYRWQEYGYTSGWITLCLWL